jgi:signal transduction histidine kinase
MWRKPEGEPVYTKTPAHPILVGVVQHLPEGLPMNRSRRINRPAQATDDAAALRTILDASGDAAFVVDCGTRECLYVSVAVERMLGYQAAEFAAQIATPVAGSALFALAQELDERLRRLASSEQDGGHAACELDMTTSDGRPVAVKFMSAPVVNATGDIVSLGCLLRDQSQQRERAAQQKRFASMLNHEFRTPLSTIDGAIQRLEATSAHADEPTRQRYRKIAVAVDRLIAMLDEYLSPDRMAELGKERAPNAVAPNQLLEEAAAQARAAGREVRLALESLPASLRCDPAGLRLAMKVLVDNALMFSPAGSAIELAGRALSNGIEMTVRDHGPGVPEQDAARVFDKSYRGSNAAGLPGNGLGLYMARSVLEVHGGAIELVPTPAGGGLFKIFLPMTISDGKSIATDVISSDNRLKQAGVDATKAPQP